MNKGISWSIFLLFLWVSIPSLFPQNVPTPPNPGKNINWNIPQTHLYYADWLADSGDYYRAIGEYKKVLFYFPEYEKKPWVFFQIGRMYYMGGHYDLAIGFLTPLTNTPDPQLRLYTLNWLGLAHYENKDYVVSYQIFQDLKKNAGPMERMDYDIYSALSLMNQRKYAEAEILFQQIQKQSKNPEFADLKNYHTFIHKTSEDLKNINERHRPIPWLAGVAGVFPGGGYFYLKKWDYAFVSLSLIGLTGFLAYDGWVDANMVQATIFSTLGISFYVGSIYSGYRSATKIRSEWGDDINARAEHRVRELSFRIRHQFRN